MSSKPTVTLPTLPVRRRAAPEVRRRAALRRLGVPPYDRIAVARRLVALVLLEQRARDRELDARLLALTAGDAKVA